MKMGEEALQEKTPPGAERLATGKKDM